MARTAIAGATSSSLVLGAAQVGKRITCDVTGANDAGFATATSLPTDVVVPVSEPAAATLYDDSIDPPFDDGTYWTDD